ncbi:hypothetical protein N7532_008353 [Penicillium argentinense]|uniref:Uncharacterized protein n=1 Tax=Penicillium argentinense TaxID=1131581 RepID=A0A9W9K1I3_9EURO|nr:uncharacterized protein N7532_008353 [Penicillium argentinense]KAJ5089669.1 hypothetical protein N7532_008353 [Penicillium argentinense]
MQRNCQFAALLHGLMHLEDGGQPTIPLTDTGSTVHRRTSSGINGIRALTAARRSTSQML